MAGSLYHGQQGTDTRVVVKLLLDHGTEVNADRGKVVFDAMQAAAYGGDEAIVQLLLDEDADIWKEGLYGTALGAAAFVGHKAVMLDHGTDKNLVDSHGRNALLLAQASVPHNSEGIRLLLPDTQAHSA